ncbi:ribosomal protein S12 methylthiotransferase [Ruminococcus sp. YE71]|nr:MULTISPECIES: 30S ribosomal protein S12 methylthiotransferase RimO [unclassified Ruminococcus]SDA09494.1 ribosomal protein S12 methylthiotransferase [Ruminococcus sp. YE78]SFW12150.1 ribosomal protein S12 methylthiotransferase [Ruminococcus sp. YE71]
MSVKVGMVSLGCPKNQVDAEKMMFGLRAYGFELSDVPEEADIVIVNTCGFIQSAKEEAIETLLEFLALKNEGGIKGVVCTGCLAERYRDDIMESLPGIDAVVPLGNDGEIARIIGELAETGEADIDPRDKYDLPLEGDRTLIGGGYSAYLKIAEGCSNGCTYCAIPAIRGRFRSRPMENVLDEARQLAESGVTELIVVAQDTSRYGEDIYGESRIAELLTELCRIDGFRWIRTLYMYPERITDKLIDVIAKEPKLVKYLDIPIQHCNAEVLKRMNRRGDRETLAALMNKLRERIPDITLRTTLITGFVGETEEQFEELAEFVGEMRFDRLGCFAYSEEEGTPAAKMDGQVPPEERVRRSEIITEQQMFITDELMAQKVGSTLEVLIDGFDEDEGLFVGRTAADAPEIDGCVLVASDRGLAEGEYVTVHIDSCEDGCFYGSAQ